MYPAIAVLALSFLTFTSAIPSPALWARACTPDFNDLGLSINTDDGQSQWRAPSAPGSSMITEKFTGTKQFRIEFTSAGDDYLIMCVRRFHVLIQVLTRWLFVLLDQPKLPSSMSLFREIAFVWLLPILLIGELLLNGIILTYSF
jgi:hypothetical protein